MAETCERNEKPKGFKALIKSWYFWKPAAGIILGGIAGFVYYYNVGCASGSCGIASNPYSSILMGGLFGLFITNRPCGSC